MVWTRSSRDDFDKYARLSGDPGWSWDAIEPYFKRVVAFLASWVDTRSTTDFVGQIEHLVPPADHHNITGEIQPRIHGTRGPVNISIAAVPLPPDEHVLETTRELSSEFPFNEDQNGGDPLGIGTSGRRCYH